MAALSDDDTRAFANPHPLQGRDDVHAEVDEPTASLAWRILTSPRTFGVLSASLALWLALASVIPQRLLMTDSATHMSFAAAEAARDVGLDDVLVSWPLQLIALLMVLNLAGLWLASRIAGGSHFSSLFVAHASADVAAPPSEVQARLLTAIGGRVAVTGKGDTTIATRGFLREGLVVAAIGIATLFAALAVSRGSALDGRLSLIPGAATLPESSIRDGELMLLRQLPLGLFCGRPDPQDPSRTFPCRAAATGGAPLELALTPGRTTHVGAFAVRPLAESLRVPRDTDPVALVIRRGGQMERLSVELGKTVELKRGGERITPLAGPDGPLVVLQQVVDGRPVASLLAPPDALTAASPGLQPLTDLQVEVEHPTTVSVAVTTSPEWPLVLAGLGLVVLGLLLAAALPHIRVRLSPSPSGTRVEVESANRHALVASVLSNLTQSAAAPPRASLLGALRQDLPSTAIAVVLVGVGLALGLGASLGSAALPLGLGALVALGTKAAPALGALTLVAGLGTAPHAAMPSLFELLAILVGGLGLGLAGRWLATHDTIAKSPLVLAGLLALALGALHLMPSPALQLSEAGGPLVAQALMADGPSSMRVLWPSAAFTAGDPNPLAPLLWLGLAIAVACFAFQQRPGDQRLRLLNHVVLAFGALAVVAGLVGLVQLLGSGALPAEVFRHQLDLSAERSTALAAPALTYELQLWSRPFLDGLTLVCGLALTLLAITARRARPEAPRPSTHQTSTLPLLVTAALALVAFILGIARGLDGEALLFMAAAIIALGALVSSFAPRTPSAPNSAQGNALPLMSPLLVLGALALGVAACFLPPLIAA